MKRNNFHFECTDRKVIRVLVCIVAIAAGIAFLTSCSREDGEIEPESGGMTIRFGIPQWMPDTIVSMDELDKARTRGAITADGKAMTDLWVIDYMDGTLQGTPVHQTSDQEDFAQPALTLAFGEHTLYFVASRGIDPTLSTEDHTIVWDKTSDTFYKAVTLTVSRGTSTAQTVTMTRVAAKLKVSVTDQVPAAADKLILTPSTWYYGLDYLTGNAVSSSDKDRPVTIPDSYKESDKRVSMDIFGLTPAEEFTTDVSVRCEASDGTVISSASIEGATIRRNCVTTYTGELFSTSAYRGFSLTVGDAEWGEDGIGTW